MKQYLELCKRILDEGVWSSNRTGTRCLTVINADLVYDVGAKEFPLVSTRKCYWKPALAEMLGYLRGYDSAAEFRALGTKTWDANANNNTAWLNNPTRLGVDDCGAIYGVVARDWQGIDTIQKVMNNLTNGIDDRGEIISFWNPAMFDKSCLRPCMYEHQFSILGDTLHLNSTQRSCDVPLGLTFNMQQCYFLLAIVAHITGFKPGKAHHKIVNAHIYENQIDKMREQLSRTPISTSKPRLHIDNDIRTFEDLDTWVNLDNFSVSGYESHPPINYPLSV